MPRLSLWRENKGNDYRFFDRRISEMFTVGGTDVNIHKYLGPIDQSTTVATSSNQGSVGAVLTFSSATLINVGQFVAGTGIPTNTTVISKDATTITLSTATTIPVVSGATISFYNNATQPPSTGILSVQDLLFLENRDNKYDTSIYRLRSIYRINDNDFDLSQFGLFLTGDTLFMTFHLNDMIETLGRKIMAGDVMELPHLKDYYPLDDSIEVSLKRFYVVQEATRAAEGFAPTWYPHLWRAKMQPLVDSQEYKDIVDHIKAGAGTTKTIGDVSSLYDKYIAINDAIIAQAEYNVPKSGYDVSSIYHVPVQSNGYPGDPDGTDASEFGMDASETDQDASSSTLSPDKSVAGYLTGDGIPPNLNTVAAGITFPSSPMVGDFYLRLDFMPNRLFRFDNKRWVKIEDAVRTNLGSGPDNKSQLSGFVNNSKDMMVKLLAWDVIKVDNPYIPPASAITSSYNFTTNTILTKIGYVPSYGVRTILNGNTITNTASNTSGNIGIVVTSTINIGDRLEYRIYEETHPERQSLTAALTIRADN